MLTVTLKYRKERRSDKDVFVPERLPHGSSPYWKDNLAEWRKLRAYREGIRSGKVDPEVVIQVNAESWCKAHGIEAEKPEDAFLASNTGLKEVKKAPETTKKDFGNQPTSKKE